MKRLQREKLERISGYNPKLHDDIPSIKHEHYQIIWDVSVGGDAPKELMKMYVYKQGKPQVHNKKLWSSYIVKTGHKWYPYESITEFMLNRLGCTLGLNMAQAGLAKINGQIRFHSKIFLSRNELLEHGAEIYSGYLGDKDFVEEIEIQKLAREFFTLSFTRNALKHIYPEHWKTIYQEFAKMLVFDAIIGNNDRHFYNWGVVKNIRDLKKVQFSPIYDTARALFWNVDEAQLERWVANPTLMRQRIEKYVDQSQPKIGIEGMKNINHFQIISKLFNDNEHGTKEIVESLINDNNKKSCLELINDEFKDIVSESRLKVIEYCLTLRFERMKYAINN